MGERWEMRNAKTIRSAVDILKAGGIVAFPTDTVYGIAAMPFNKKAVRKLYNIKKREKKKPVALLISSKSAAAKFAANIPACAGKLISRHWPGPLTLIFKKKRSVPDFLTAGLPSIGIRMPKNKIALALIRKAGGALAVTSANISGKKPAVSAGQIKRLKGIDLIIDGGKCKIGMPSSVIAVTGGKLQVLRKGSVKIGSQA
jgi:L-threonylcarbamoyladenylate synthase